MPSAVPLAAASGAARAYYRPREVARLAHRHGVYLIGRVVCVPGSRCSRRRGRIWRSSAPDGSVWRDERRARVGEPVRPRGSGTTSSRSRRWPRKPASTRSCSTTSASHPTVTSARAVYPGRTTRAPGARDRRLRRVRRAPARSARRARLDGRCSGCPRPVISGSARFRAGSRGTSTRSRRWRTRRSTANGELGIPDPVRRAGRDGLPDAGRLPPSAAGADVRT